MFDPPNVTLSESQGLPTANGGLVGLEHRSRRTRDEKGQVLVLAVLAMIVLLGITGFAVDVGHAYLVQRQLQSGVDAAALAGAQELPDGTAVVNAANAYSASPTKKNAVTSNDNATTTVTLRCVTTVVGCNSTFGTHNAVQVDGTSNVRTYFARVLGINNLTVHASATACSPCSAKPLDVMVVLDRTGSMCDVRNSDGTCRDEVNAINGIKTFLGFMDPTLDEVGLAVFPPTLEGSCATPTQGAKRYGYDAAWPEWTLPANSPLRPAGIYTMASAEFDYLIQTTSGWQLNGASPLVQRLNSCVNPAGTTSYSNAIDEAQHELEVHGRGNVQDVMIVLTDGAANTTPRFLPGYLDNAYDRARPCGAGIKAAAHVKGLGVIVYTIGYDVDADSNGGQCGIEGFNASYALQQIASEPDNYYVKPDPGQLNTIFTRIAADISRPSSRLIG